MPTLYVFVFHIPSLVVHLIHWPPNSPEYLRVYVKQEQNSYTFRTLAGGYLCLRTYPGALGNWKCNSAGPESGINNLQVVLGLRWRPVPMA